VEVRVGVVGSVGVGGSAAAAGAALRLDLAAGFLAAGFLAAGFFAVGIVQNGRECVGARGVLIAGDFATLQSDAADCLIPRLMWLNLGREACAIFSPVATQEQGMN
jgi:hypothetical protein